MKYCMFCGKALNDEDKFCTGCGQAVQENNANSVNYTDTVNYANNVAGDYRAQQYHTEPDKDKKPLLSMIIGIVGFILSATGLLGFIRIVMIGPQPFLMATDVMGIILGIIAIVLSKSSSRKKERALIKLGRTGRTFGIIAIALCSIWLVIMTIMSIAVFVLSHAMTMMY